MVYYLFKIYYLYKYIYHVVFTPFYKIGWPVVFGRGVEIYTSRYIEIGNKVVIGNGAHVQVSRFHHFKYGTHKPKLKIGNNVTIGKGSTISAVSNIEIEDNVGIAGYCFMADNSHGFERIDMPIMDQELFKVMPIKIKSGSWLGWNVVVSPGVTIGRNCVIGAHSVVNKDIPDYCVAVGAPAKIVKRYNLKLRKWERIN